MAGVLDGGWVAAVERTARVRRTTLRLLTRPRSRSLKQHVGDNLSLPSLRKTVIFICSGKLLQVF